MVQNKLIIFMPSIDDGGVEKNFFLISNYLSKKLSKVAVITISKKYQKNLDNNIELITTKSKWHDKIGRRKKFFIALFLLFLETISNKKVTVLCFQANIYCTILCKLLSIKIIIRSNTSSTGWSQNRFKRFFYKKIFNFANHVIVNSEEFKNELLNEFNVKSTCIYNPLNAEQIKKLSKEKINFNFFKKNTLNIICVARLNEQKDHFCLLKAMNKIKDKIQFKLVLIGGGIEREKIKTFIKNNSLSKNIKIINFQKNPFPYIRKSDLFILTSKYEGLPNVLLEAIVLDKFIISSNCPTGPSEILDKGKGGLLFKIGDHNSLVKKILYFVNKNKKCKHKINHAKKRLNRFDYSKNLFKYNKLLLEYL